MIRHHPNLRYPPLVTTCVYTAFAPRMRSDSIQHHGTRSRVHFQRDQDRAEGDGRTGTHGEVPRRTTPPEWQQHEQVCAVEVPS